MDHDAAQMALRARANGLVICTTGLATLAATTTGFTRTVGSFIDDRFVRGMEVVSSGFIPAVDNMRGIITSVSPTDMRVTPFVIAVAAGVQTVAHPALVADPAMPGRMIFAGLPVMQALENTAPSGLTLFTPIAGIPYLEEEYSPSTHRTTTVPIRSARTEDTGDYIWKWHGVPGVGPSAIRRSVGALQDRYASGTIIPAGNDDIHIPGDNGPEMAEILQLTTGPIIILTIPWVVNSRNAITA
jgi:hypothetical protein